MAISKIALTILSTVAVSSLFAQCPAGSPCAQRASGNYGDGYYGDGSSGYPGNYPLESRMQRGNPTYYQDQGSYMQGNQPYQGQDQGQGYYMQGNQPYQGQGYYMQGGNQPYYPQGQRYDNDMYQGGRPDQRQGPQARPNAPGAAGNYSPNATGSTGYTGSTGTK